MEETFNDDQTVWSKEDSSEWRVIHYHQATNTIWATLVKGSGFTGRQWIANANLFTGTDPNQKQTRSEAAVINEVIAHATSQAANASTSRGLKVGQTAWHKDTSGMDIGPLSILAIDGEFAWVIDRDTDRYTLLLEDLCAEDPREPAMQACPVCGGGAQMAGTEASGKCRVFCLKSDCILGPVRPTRIEAIRKWNSLAVLRDPEQVKVKTVYADVLVDALKKAADECKFKDPSEPKFKVGDNVIIVGRIKEVDTGDMPYLVEFDAPSDSGDLETVWFTGVSLHKVPT